MSTQTFTATLTITATPKGTNPISVRTSVVDSNNNPVPLPITISGGNCAEITYNVVYGAGTSGWYITSAGGYSGGQNATMNIKSFVPNGTAGPYPVPAAAANSSAAFQFTAGNPPTPNACTQVVVSDTNNVPNGKPYQMCSFRFGYGTCAGNVQYTQDPQVQNDPGQ